ncbi:MAG: tRNA uridine-5-carboxymethylaminomethyl(34) synthesis GTPase MnmE [Pseudomonadota bacterium]
MIGHSDTIFALSTPGLPAALAVIRISGPKVRFVIETMCGRLPEPRVAGYLSIADPESGSVIDRGLVLWFPSPASFTGEDMAELQVHGGPAVVRAILDSLVRLKDMRIAEAGEFTYRAFINGKMDLTAVEGLADLISAETESQRRQALRQGEGRLGRIYTSWRERLIRVRAMIEAELDFADEDDVPDDPKTGLRQELENVLSEIRDHLHGSTRSRAIRSGLSVVLQGAPNVGKSSLLNALSRRDAAIVSAEAGTTRDVVTVPMDLGGYLFSISDTAGIRETVSSVEAEGVRRSLEAGRRADLILWLDDGSEGSRFDKDQAAPGSESAGGVPVWIVASKMDLRTETGANAIRTADILISSESGLGLEMLEQKLIAFGAARLGSGSDDLATRARHVEELQRTAAGLQAALHGTERPVELMAEDLRSASDALGRLTGRIDVEDLLDVIFSEFCIGK